MATGEKKMGASNVSQPTVTSTNVTYNTSISVQQKKGQMPPLKEMSSQELSKLTKNLNKIPQDQWPQFLQQVSDLEISVENDFKRVQRTFGDLKAEYSYKNKDFSDKIIDRRNNNKDPSSKTENPSSNTEVQNSEEKVKEDYTSDPRYQKTFHEGMELQAKQAALQEIQKKILSSSQLVERSIDSARNLVKEEVTKSKSLVSDMRKKIDELVKVNKEGLEVKKSFAKDIGGTDCNPAKYENCTREQKLEIYYDIKEKRIKASKDLENLYKGKSIQEFRLGFHVSPFLLRIATHMDRDLNGEVKTLLEEVHTVQKSAKKALHGWNLNDLTARTNAEGVAFGGPRDTVPEFLDRGQDFTNMLMIQDMEIARTGNQLKECGAPLKADLSRIELFTGELRKPTPSGGDQTKNINIVNGNKIDNKQTPPPPKVTKKRKFTFTFKLRMPSFLRKLGASLSRLFGGGKTSKPVQLKQTVQVVKDQQPVKVSNIQQSSKGPKLVSVPSNSGNGS
jgi:hypothetical protein